MINEVPSSSPTNLRGLSPIDFESNTLRWSSLLREHAASVAVVMVIDLARRMQQPGVARLQAAGGELTKSRRIAPAAARCQLSTSWMTSAVDSLRGRGAPPMTSSWLSTAPPAPAAAQGRVRVAEGHAWSPRRPRSQVFSANVTQFQQLARRACRHRLGWRGSLLSATWSTFPQPAGAVVVG